MRSRFSLLFCLCVLICIGCSKEEVSSIIDDPLPCYEVASDNFVSINQIRNYANTIRPQAKSNGEPDYTITPYGELDDTPLVYIVNYGEGNGWQILSSDARTPAVIAEGERGYFSLDEGSPAVRIWMDCMASDIAAVRRASDDNLCFSSEEIAANKQIWSGSGQSKDGDEGGHWAVTVSSREITIEEIEHMTPHWDQYAPYNACCPLQYPYTLDRVPAGCVAIAAAEVLYYLHYKFGVPESMYSFGYCSGHYYDHYWYFDYPTTTSWSQMDSSSHLSDDPALAEAIMIGSIVRDVGMHFWLIEGEFYSWALPANIRTNIFSPNGISSSHGDYDASIVKSNLEDHLPVIITASNLLIPTDGDLHTFVIDGFKKTYTQYTYYHYWVPDDPNVPKGHFDPDHMPYITYSQTTPDISAIKINWGWKSQWHGNNGNNPVNDGWYGLTASWQVTNGNTYTYNHHVKMIYNMAVAD